MTLRCVALLGEVGVGKTTLVRALRAELGPGEPVSWGLLYAERYPAQRLLILGIWHGATQFPGTDTLHPEANDWLQLLIRDHARLLGPGWTILWDGPWATSMTLGVAFNRSELHLVHLSAGRRTLDERLAQRGVPHDPDWLLAMHERDAATVARWKACLSDFRHVTRQDWAANLTLLRSLVGLAPLPADAVRAD